MSFVSFEVNTLDGGRVEWILCCLGRWLHVDCAKGQVRDKNREESYFKCVLIFHLCMCELMSITSLQLLIKLFELQ